MKVFEENIPNVHCRTSIALGELQLGGFQMGAGGCWAPLQWEVVLGRERLGVGPQLGLNTRESEHIHSKRETIGRVYFSGTKIWRKKYVNWDKKCLREMCVNHENLMTFVINRTFSKKI